MQPVDALIRSDTALPFRVNAGESAALGWQLAIPEGLQAVTCRVTAQAAGHVDGEEVMIPVLPNAVPVTETMPFCVRAGEERSLTFDRLANHRSATLRTQRLTLEYAASPAWYAVQALPYLMEYPQACAEQTFARFYANALASAVGRRSPRIRRVFDNWQKLGGDALASNLEKNTALKQLFLEETPWVAQAVDESERKRRLGLLFDLNRMGNEMSRSLDLLTQLQNEDGGFPWFAGQPSNRFITQHILAGMAHIERLDALPLPHAEVVDSIRLRGMRFIARELREDSARLTGRGEQTLTLMLLHALYACSFNGLPPEEASYVELAARSWKNLPSYGKAMAALVLHRNSRTAEAQAIVRSLKEYALLSPDLGMYWKDNVAGDRWFQSPVEAQAMLIEAFDEVAADREAVEEMKIWLLRHKQTNGWRTTKATTEAVYALLMTGGDLLSESASPEIALAGRPLTDVAPESGTGYATATWYGGDNLAAAAAGMTVKNPNRLGIVWGGLYWQYVERLDKIASPADRHLMIKKALFLRTLTGAGEVLQPVGERTRLQVGDLVRVRMELRADRYYEFVHLKDLRAAGLEPVNVRSGNRFQDGLLYYESVKDASVNFFIHALPKGVYVFEYDLRASNAGDFSNGITTFQCMYAPEFAAHSEGLRLSIARP